MTVRVLVAIGCILVTGGPFSVGAMARQNAPGVQGAVPPMPPVRVGGNIRAPTRTRNVNPQYPPVAQSARVQGVVIIEATIGATGDVTDARILRSIPLLDQAALDAVRQWQYSPTLVNGVPVPIIMTVTVQFTLQTNADAMPRPCSVEPTLKAPAATAAATSLRFVNQSGQPRKLYRLDATGQRVWDLTLGEVGTSEQSTVVGQPWMVTNAADECLGIYVAEPTRLNVTLGPGTGVGR